MVLIQILQVAICSARMTAPDVDRPALPAFASIRSWLAPDWSPANRHCRLAGDLSTWMFRSWASAIESNGGYANRQRHRRIPKIATCRSMRGQRLRRFIAPNGGVLSPRSFGWCGDFDLAEEVAQEAFAAAVQDWPSRAFQSSRAAWIIQTARHKAIDRTRRKATSCRDHSQPGGHRRDSDGAESDADGGEISDDRFG